MPPRFQRISIDQFAELVRQFPFRRSINAVHMHHTWRPNHAQFRGHDSIVGMWRHHTEMNGWSDIAQHITIDPEGMIWTGRDWNRAPASAAGHNGGSSHGPFMFEMIGDFDKGKDAWTGAQRDTTLRVIAVVQKKFDLAPEALAFHRSMSTKTCPGSGIEFDAVLEDVRRLHAEETRAPAKRGARAKRGRGGKAAASSTSVDALLEEMAARAAAFEGVVDAAEAEGDHGEPAVPAEGDQRGRRPRRRALCVGINKYPSAPLSGCVADAKLWAKTLSALGFDKPTLLLDEKATRSGILGALDQLVAASRPGDVIAFQYSGHGTTVPDITGDEADGESPDNDEALCPFDMDAGRLLIDDDVAKVLARIPASVSFTCFMDCCHSGTITRMIVGGAPRSRSKRVDERPRFILATPELIEAHVQFRKSEGLIEVPSSRGPSTMREVVFSACQSTEVAWESGGQGDFTLRANRLLAAGIDDLTNDSFAKLVAETFGPRPRQHPVLDCAPAAVTRGLLQPIGVLKAQAAAPAAHAPAGASESPVVPRFDSLAALSAEEKANLLKLIAQLA